MKYLKKTIQLFITSLMVMQAKAQSNNIEMADVMRSNGKIYVVVAICLTILIGLFLYVWKIDQKINRMERKP